MSDFVPNILYVDDDPQILRVFKRHLSRGDLKSWKVTTVDSPKAALELIAEREFHVIAADYELNDPDINGIEFFRRLNDVAPAPPRVLITAYQDLHVAIQAINVGVFGFVVKPWDPAALRNTMENAVEHIRLKLENEALQRALEAKMAELETLNRYLEEEVSRRTKALLDGLTFALDFRDTETHWHSRRVSQYALSMAERAGLEGQDLLDVEWGALLHDVGKIGVPDHILLKPAKLTAEEWLVMQQHPVLGYKLLKGIEFLEGAARIVLQHHERYDGKGYPRGLKGKEIVVGARIFAVVDTYDAITSDRPHRKARSHDVAVAEIVRVRGSQLDPDMVDIFLSFDEAHWREIRERVQRISDDDHRPVTPILPPGSLWHRGKDLPSS